MARISIYAVFLLLLPVACAQCYDPNNTINPQDVGETLYNVTACSLQGDAGFYHSIPFWIMAVFFVACAFTVLWMLLAIPIAVFGGRKKK